MGKRKAAQPPIAVAFARARVPAAAAASQPQAAAAAATAASAAAPLEAAAASTHVVPDDFLSEPGKEYELYCCSEYAQAPAGAALHARSSMRAGDPHADDGTDDGAGSCIACVRWQAHGAKCVRELGRWAGGRVALQQQLQEWLLHIVALHDRHPDAQLSPAAYRLLLLNARAHPPCAAAAAAADGQAAPPVLQVNEQMWHPMAAPASSAQGAPRWLRSGRFGLLNDLVRNAAHIVYGAASAGSGQQAAASHQGGAAAPSQGNALLLLYLVQLLATDCSTRVAVFEAHLRAAHASGGGGGGTPLRVRQRAAALLQNSLLWRVMADDPSWVLDSVGRGKHAMLRELLRLAAAPASGAAPQPPAAAPAAAQPVSAGELVGAARVLLQQLLRLYSAAEAGGVYVGQQAARGAASTSAANDRFQLDAVLKQALSGGWMLPELRAPAALQRLLCTLPPAHLVRLCALLVAEAIHCRSYEERGTAPNAHMDALHAYWGEQGHGCSSFTAGDALEVARAVADRVDWAAREVAGGKDAFVLLMCSLVNAALPGHALLQPGAEAAKAFAQSARRVLEHVAQAGRPRWAGAAAEAGSDVSEVVLSLAAAMREVAAAAAGS